MKHTKCAVNIVIQSNNMEAWREVCHDNALSFPIAFNRKLGDLLTYNLTFILIIFIRTQPEPESNPQPGALERNGLTTYTKKQLHLGK